MKLKLKPKLMAAAVAATLSLAAVSGAQAAILTGSSGNSELVLFAFDVTTNNASMWDLGVHMNDFLTTTAAVNTPGAQIQWNLSTGSITANAFAAGYAGATGASAASYGTALAQIAAYGAGNVRWGVIALDNLNPMRFLTTSWFDFDMVSTTDPTNITAFSLSNDFLVAHNSLGTNADPNVAHGASHAISGNGKQDEGFGAEDWRGKMAVTATGAVTGIAGAWDNAPLSFYSLATTAAGAADYHQHAGQWSFDLAGGTLTYEVAAVIPEPSEYALMLAGLGMLGFMMRRRTRQQ